VYRAAEDISPQSTVSKRLFDIVMAVIALLRVRDSHGVARRRHLHFFGRTNLVRTTATGRVRSPVRDVQVSEHASTDRGLDLGCRSSDAVRAMATSDQSRRVARTLERVAGRDEFGRAPSAVARVSAAVFASSGAAPRGASGDHRMGASQWAQCLVLGGAVRVGRVVR
jgi:hypothetical protein